MNSVVDVEKIYKGIVDFNLGGVYVGFDGRELAKTKFEFSQEVRVALGEGYQTGDITLNRFEIGVCLERLLGSVSREKEESRATALRGIREIFDVLMKDLCELPDHPRLFRFEDVFQTAENVALVSKAAPQDSTGLEALRLLENPKKPHGDALLSSSTQTINPERSANLAEGDETTSVTPSRSVSNPTVNHHRQLPRLLRSQVSQVFKWVESYACNEKDFYKYQEAVLFLSEVVRQVSSKLAMMTADGYEYIAGTKLFYDPEKAGAISRVALEHAILRSNADELCEAVRVAAILIARGSSSLAPQDLISIGVNADCRCDIAMDGERQIHSGLRILRLIQQLSDEPDRFTEVLKAYSKQALQLPNNVKQIMESCRYIWSNRGEIDPRRREAGSVPSSDMKRHLVRIISGGRAQVSDKGEITCPEIPSIPNVSAP